MNSTLNSPSAFVNDGLVDFLKSPIVGAFKIADAFCLALANSDNWDLFCKPSSVSKEVKVSTTYLKSIRSLSINPICNPVPPLTASNADLIVCSFKLAPCNGNVL